MKINIKIQNQYGVNSFKGEDLDVSTAQHLMDVAKEMIIGERLTSSTPLTYIPFDNDEIQHGILNVDSNIHTPLRMYPTVKHGEGTSTDKQVSKQEMKAAAAESAATTIAPTPIVKKTVPLTPANPGAIVYSSPKDEDDNSMASKLKEAGVVTLTATNEPLAVISIQERLAEMNKDYFTTGIKYKEYQGEIVPNYRLRYNCPKCNEQGNHYVPENVKNVFCYSCNAALTPEQSTKKFLEPDGWGNFFVANKLNTKFIKA